MTLVRKICTLIDRNPGLTQKQIAARLFGDGTPQQRVSYQCQYLARTRQVERRGVGLQYHPYRYFPRQRVAADARVPDVEKAHTTKVTH